MSPTTAAANRAPATGLFALLTAIVMFFSALFSAMVVRRGLGGDWESLPVPPLLWINTAVLAAATVFLEINRRRPAIAAATTFLALQLLLFRQLAQTGIYLSTNPSHAFFYVLTAAHALHIAGGIAALAISRSPLVTWYWRFLALLWVLILAIFVFWS